MDLPAGSGVGARPRAVGQHHVSATIRYCWLVASVLVVSDNPGLASEVEAALDDHVVKSLSDPMAAAAAVASGGVDVLVADGQVANMGAVALTMHLRLEESGGRSPHVGVVILLDRRPDVFLARRCGADAFVVKPLDPFRVRDAVDAAASGTPFEDPSFRPEPTIQPAGA